VPTVFYLILAKKKNQDINGLLTEERKEPV